MITTGKKPTPMVWFVILAVVTVSLALFLPPDPHTLRHLHISSVEYRIIISTLLVPYIVIWYTSFYAYAKLKEYVSVIKDSDDGIAFRKIKNGLAVLAFGLSVPTALSLILNNISSHHHDFLPASVVIEHYVSIIVILITFAYISSGSRLLSIAAETRPGIAFSRIFSLLYLSLAAIFTYLTTHYQEKHHTAYYLNIPLLIITFIIPYLYAWYLAIYSAYEFKLYAQHTSGFIYQRAFRLLAYGVVVTIFGSVVSQFIQSTFAARARHSLGLLLVLEYVLLAIIAVGLILIARGTLKLKKIEEV